MGLFLGFLSCSIDLYVCFCANTIDNQQGPTVQQRNDSQYFVITYKGKEPESLCCTPETNTINYTSIKK